MFYDFWTHLRDVHFRIPNMPNAFKHTDTHIEKHNTTQQRTTHSIAQYSTQSVNQSATLYTHPKSRLEFVLVSYHVLAIFCYLGAFNTIECFVKKMLRLIWKANGRLKNHEMIGPYKCKYYVVQQSHEFKRTPKTKQHSLNISTCALCHSVISNCAFWCGRY